MMSKSQVRKIQAGPKAKANLDTLGIVHANAAGIDIGSREIWVALPPDRADETVRCFGTFTPDLESLADGLSACGIDTGAMESTGVYWIPLFEILEARGIRVFLVNARHVKHVPGRKSDVLDCQSPKGSPRGRRGAQAKRSGSKSCIAWVCCKGHSGPLPRWSGCGLTCATGLNSFSIAPPIFYICKKPSNR
jgi:hypothetical protein